jgi:hypothetical protein
VFLECALKRHFRVQKTSLARAPVIAVLESAPTPNKVPFAKRIVGATAIAEITRLVWLPISTAAAPSPGFVEA